MKMKNIIKIIVVLAIVLAIILSIVSCSANAGTADDTHTHDPQGAATASVEPTPDAEADPTETVTGAEADPTETPADPTAEPSDEGVESEAPTAEPTDSPSEAVTSAPAETSKPTATPAPTATSKPAETAHVHSYTSSVTKAATCIEKGVRTYKCSCGDSYTETIAATGHKYTTKTVAPTTTEQGYTLHTCSVCGDSYKDNYKPATGSGSSGHKHSYSSTVTTAATCTKTGTRTYTCSCGNKYTESIPATGHSYTSKITKEATCTSNGTRTYTCSNCKDSYTDTIKATGHSYTTKVVSPTETAQGYTLHTCSKCGDSYKDNYTPATGCKHTYDSGKVTKEPTCTATGIKTYTCTKCKETKTETIAALGHDWKTTTIHHDAVYGTRDITETWVHGYEYIQFLLTQAGIDAGLDNSAEMGFPSKTGHIVKASEYWMKEGDISTKQWVYRYSNSDYYTDDLVKDFTMKYKGTGYWTSYNYTHPTTKETRVVGTETYVITPAYDETVTTCSRCGATK